MTSRIVGFVVCLMLLCSLNIVSASEVSLIENPQSVSPGQTANVKLSWKDVPIDKDYMIRTQLEDWDAKPAVCVFKDITVTQASGESTVGLPIPKNISGTTAARFVVAVMSKAKNWDDVLASAATEKTITVASAFKFNIIEYPKSVSKGSTVKVKIAWNDLTVGSDYKLIVQLENWDAKPGFAYVTTIGNFKPSDEIVVNIDIPNDALSTKNCRFVAAFISKTKNWDDVFALVSTDRDIEVK